MKHEFIILFFIVFYSCSNYEITTKPLLIDKDEVKIFSDKINSRFTNYAEVSGYNHFKDSVKIAMKNVRGPDGEEVFFFRGSPSKEEIVIYSFDRKDSCIIFSSFLSDELYLLKVNSIAIPVGKYLIKNRNNLNIFYRD